MQPNKKLESRILYTDLIEWEKLEFIQQENFKEWENGCDDKLMNSLLQFQFIDPFKVWQNKGKIYCLDGKHRYLDLIKAKQSGIEVPDKLPANFINCKNLKEAANLVLVYSSAYAKITQQGFYDFIQINGIEYDELLNFVNIPNLDIGMMKDWFMPPIESNELIGLAKNNPLTLKITFKSKAQIEAAEPLIKEILTSNCPGAFYSVGGGEL